MEKIYVIYKKPARLPELMEIENTPDEIRRLVKGCYEVVRVCPDVACVCNDEGKLNGMKRNFCTPDDVVFGPAFFAGLHMTEDGEELCSIPLDAVGEICASLGNWS